MIRFFWIILIFTVKKTVDDPETLEYEVSLQVVAGLLLKSSLARLRGAVFCWFDFWLCEVSTGCPGKVDSYPPTLLWLFIMYPHYIVSYWDVTSY